MTAPGTPRPDAARPAHVGESPSPPHDPVALAARIEARALELGFDAVGIAAADPLDASARYEAWLAAGRHGAMDYLGSAKHRARRADPTRILRDLRSVVCVALCYEPGATPERDARLGRIARYARGEDYHFVMRDRLRVLQADMRGMMPGSRALWYADTGAILERGWAERAGLGWIGKHSGVLSQSLGSWFVLGEILVDRELAPDAPVDREHCGTCTRCLTACPTQAIVAPYQVDARRCISYLTIELHGPIPRELRPLVGDWIFGCDVCQEVCPWNRFAPPAREARLHARTLEEWTLERFLELDEVDFEALFERSPIRRVGRAGFLRNVCVALGNRGGVEAVASLSRALEQDVAPLVRGHAAWALGEIAGRSGDVGGADGASAVARDSVRAALERRVKFDLDAMVREEAAVALSRCGIDDRASGTGPSIRNLGLPG